MKRSRKSNMVSWASGFNLCQVKLFLSEDCPSKVGMEFQDHLHKKPSWIVHSNNSESNDLPPGFESNHYVNKKEELFHVPQNRWKCPPKFVMSANWHVAAGDESDEVGVQKLREMRVLEAVYPRISDIPPCPAVSLEVENEGYDDHFTPVIPIIPIEEEEAAEIPSDLRTQSVPASFLPPAFPQGQLASGTTETSKPISPILEPPAKEKPLLGMSHGLGLDVVTAASAALSATMKSNEIDTQLLIKIFSDPKMIEKLTKDYGPAANTRTTTTANPVSTSISAPPSFPLVSSKPDMVQPLRSGDGKLGHMTNGMQVQPTPITTPPPPLQQPQAQLATGSVPFGPKPVNHLVTMLAPEPTMGQVPAGMGNENLYNLQNQVKMVPSMMPPAIVPPKPPLSTLVKDVNYYKNLIRQHGGDYQETVNAGVQLQYGNHHNNQHQNRDFVQKQNSRELKPKNQKLCAYFNSARGCRNGTNCPFWHDLSLEKRGGGALETQSAKRMRFNGEIIGRT